MKNKFNFFFLLFLLSLNANMLAQNFWVPDANFRNKLKQLYPTCFTAQDSLITSNSLVQSISSINVSSLNISSINGIEYFISLKSLNCSANTLSSLPTLPDSLTYLNCDFNSISSIPSLPPNLLELHFDINLLTFLPALSPLLNYLSCAGNQLTSLPMLPSSLSTLHCEYNQLSSLPSLPSSLLNLFCDYNLLTALPILPASLNLLFCTHNQLQSLPALSTNLIQLHCEYNSISSLPSLPGILQNLFCQNNYLSTLPALPVFLQLLHCENNNLSYLPNFPNSLSTLYCANNQLTYLPSFENTSLTWLHCEHNRLTELPKIPGSTIELICNNNPISCFPEIAPRIPGGQTWSKIHIDSTLITCIPNSGAFPLSVVHSSGALPFCNPNNSSCYYNYTACYVFLDSNGNGIKDTGEKGLSLPISYSGNFVMITDSSGFGIAISDTGNINFQLLLPPYYIASNPAQQTVHVASGALNSLFFGLQPISNISDLKLDLSPMLPFRSGFRTKYKLQYENLGTTTMANVKVKFLKPSQLSNLSAIPGASAVSGDTLIWNISTFPPFKQSAIYIEDSVYAFYLGGDTAIGKAWIEPILGDTTPQNNQSTSAMLIRSSYDPNDKSVNPKTVSPNTSDFLEYTVRFQNTGNDTAFTVFLTDTLSTLLDVSSVQMLNASHNYSFRIEKGVAKWKFMNILLPDSTANELESHGFVKFKIKPLPGLTLADSIPNAANIYFDYNAVVTTNTIVVNVLNPLQVKELKETALQVYPNPVQESLRIVNQHAGPLGKIELMNASGKKLETKTISSSSYTWNLQHLPAGTYILKGQGWGQKVVKE